MSQAERSERGGRQGHWRRRQHRWNGPDHFHNDNRSSGFQPLDGYHGAAIGRIGPPRQKHSPQSDGHMVGFDESMLRHMAQDCSSVKSQLLRLKNLLQMENGVSLHNTVPPEPPTPEPSENFSSAAQVEDLRREVQELKEELRRKEKTIAQLTQQLSSRAEPSRCHCQQRALLPRTERRTHHDKATQTPWRGHAGAPPAPFAPPWQGQYQGSSRVSVPHRRQTSNTTVFQPSLPQRTPPAGKAAKNSPHRGPQ
uniref:Coiled-coil serine-rich protein 2a n=2 Tax=Paramormyrops kingsleyae TaxID=1676925 RepID=A0A3B3R547_9TELE